MLPEVSLDKPRSFIACASLRCPAPCRLAPADWRRRSARPARRRVRSGTRRRAGWRPRGGSRGDASPHDAAPARHALDLQSIGSIAIFTSVPGPVRVPPLDGPCPPAVVSYPWEPPVPLRIPPQRLVGEAGTGTAPILPRKASLTSTWELPARPLGWIAVSRLRHLALLRAPRKISPGRPGASNPPRTSRASGMLARRVGPAPLAC